MRKRIILLALLATAAPALAYAVTVTVGARIIGDLSVTGALSKGSGSFFIDHPLDPRNKILFHSFVESPDVKNIYDGIATLDAHGEAVVVLPDYFEALNKDFRYQYFPLDEAMPGLYLKQEVQENTVIIAGGTPGGRVSWQVTGSRHDPYIVKHPIINEVYKGVGQPVDRGEYLFEGYRTE